MTAPSTPNLVPPRRGTVFPFVRVLQPGSAEYEQFSGTITSFAEQKGKQANTKPAMTLSELRTQFGGNTKTIRDVWGDSHTIDTNGLDAFGPDALFVVGWREFLPGHMPARFLGTTRTVVEQP